MGTVFKVELKDSKSVMPRKAHDSDAGFDLFSREEVRIEPYERRIAYTGVTLELLEGWEAQIRSRSGMAYKGITVANSPGTIDAGFRGEIGVILENRSGGAVLVMPGDKIAQIVFSRVHDISLVETGEVSRDTARGDGGFGSSGR